MNPKFQSESAFSDVELICEEAEIDEQWSFVGNKSNQLWIWYAIEHSSNVIWLMFLVDEKILFLRN